jgi:hypothetical protein
MLLQHRWLQSTQSLSMVARRPQSPAAKVVDARRRAR